MKKFLALVTLVCMTLTAVAAFAEFPSKTAGDLTQIGAIETVTGVEVDPSFAIVVAEETEEIAAQIESMREVVAAGQALLTFFPEAVQQEVLAVMPAAETAVAYELVPVAAANYEEAYGDVEVEFAFATAFEEGTEVVVLLGMPNAEAENGMDWVVKQGVVAEGVVRVTFTQDELVRMEADNALMVIMSAPIA